MGVYIKDMEMPKSRGEYVFLLYVDSDGTATVEGAHSILKGEPFEAVPVRPHGRLIDADALLNRDADYEYPLFDTDGSWDCVVPCYDRETIKSAPTVIEAEENNAAS